MTEMEQVEQLAAELYAICQQEARRHGDTDDLDTIRERYAIAQRLNLGPDEQVGVVDWYAHDVGTLLARIEQLEDIADHCRNAHRSLESHQETP